MAIVPVDTAVAATANNGLDVVFNLATLFPNRAAGDVFVIVGGKDRGSTIGAAGPSAGSGWTQIADNVEASSAQQPQLGAWYKRMGSTPDTSVTCVGGGATSDAAGYVIYCRRGVDATTPLDAAAVTATSTVDPPAVTTVTNDAEVFAAAASAVDDSTPGNLAGYTTTLVANQTDSRPYTAAVATKVVPTAGTENPPTFSTFSTNLVSQALTFALRPASAGATQQPAAITVAATTASSASATLRAAAAVVIAAATATSVAAAGLYPAAVTVDAVSGSSVTASAKLATGVASSATSGVSIGATVIGGPAQHPAGVTVAAVSGVSVTAAARLATGLAVDAVSGFTVAAGLLPGGPVVERDVTATVLPDPIVATALPDPITVTVLPPPITVRSHPMTTYADDTDASKDYTLRVTDDRGDLDFTPTVTATRGDTEIALTADWFEPLAGDTRRVRVNLAGLSAGLAYNLRLVVPGGNDLDLGTVVPR